MRGTNNAVLGNFATAFRSAADEAIPGFGATAHTPSGGHGQFPFAVMTGKEFGRHLGTMFGSPASSAIGPVARPVLSWGAGKIAASNALQSEAAQGATWQGMASVRTTPR